MIYLVSWLGLSVIVGMLGSNRNIGFAGAFFLSLILSPLIGIIITLISKDKANEAYKEELLHAQKKTVEIAEKQSAVSVTQELDKLVKMKEDGHITEDEFINLKSKLFA